MKVGDKMTREDNSAQSVLPVLVLLGLLALMVWLFAPPPRTAVYFAQPTDGAVVSTTFPVRMVARGVALRPAGDSTSNSGHFHILINADFVPPGQPIPADEHHLHFGKAQSETTLTLAPGVYTLRLQLGDGQHIALDGAQYRDEITIQVVESMDQ